MPFHSSRGGELLFNIAEKSFLFAEALKKIDKCIEDVGLDFPNEYSENNVYKKVANEFGWGNGFWSGILWHAYQLTGNEEAKRAAIKAADHLITRYQEKGQFIQAWGNVDDPKSYRLIVDCLLNIPLLYWASEVTGDKKYDQMAFNHFNSTVEVCCRADASTYHSYYFDPATGAPLKGVTHQGAFDDSAWARGQTWGIYGPMLTYIYKKSDKAMQVFKATTNYFLNELPESNGLLLHQTYAKPQGIGIDEHNIWGDYFYFEALHRMLEPDWELYW